MRFQLGPQIRTNGIAFTLYCEKANSVDLVTETSRFPMIHTTDRLFTLFIPNIDELTYRFSIDGTEIIDPWAPEIVSAHQWGQEPYHPWSRITIDKFDWEGIKKPNIQREDLILYELHVRGFTKKAAVEHPGTFLGLIEKLPYLKSLGINALELMPVTEFNESEIHLINPNSHTRLTNYWGYSPVSFKALMNRYGVINTLIEFKTLVREAHRHGIKIILDLVFNHTAEGNESGPIYHFKKMGKESFYFIENGQYRNDSGCGNTVNAKHPAIQLLIIDTLRYFANVCQVDGFRFDLAAILIEGAETMMDFIAKDPFLGETILIAEPWDIARFRLGVFAERDPQWSEWNASFRDDARHFMRGDPWAKGRLATRLSGSEDIFRKSGPLSSLNFVTCHDGFTLHDLVSYNQKHNISNGEDNRDGNNYNISDNCGKEGATSSIATIALREQKIHTYLVLLLLAKGTPMLHMGDEIEHSKRGNNNSWAHDDFLNEFDWTKVENAPLIPFIQKLIQLRLKTPLLLENRFLKKEDVVWLTDFALNDNHLAYILGQKLLIALNGSKLPMTLHLPQGIWRDAITGTAIDVEVVTIDPFGYLVAENNGSSHSSRE